MSEQEVKSDATTDNLSVLVISLLKGVIYQEGDNTLWNSLLNLQARVRDYVTVMGLELALDEAEGYAFLRSRAETDEDTNPKPQRLIARRQLISGQPAAGTAAQETGRI
jgi:hypothetical protein